MNPDGFIERRCPLCGADDRRTIVELRQDDFTLNNETYRVERIPELRVPADYRYPIVACNACSMEYTLYHLDEGRERFLYSELIDPEKSWSKVMSYGRRRGDVARWLSLLTIPGAPDRDTVDLNLLDYGSGWGTLLQQANGPGVTVTGFDFTPWKNEWARAHGVTVVESDAAVLDRGPYDICVSTSVLEHMHDPAASLKVIARALKPDGIALVSCDVFGGLRWSNRRKWAEVERQLATGTMIRKEINAWEHHNYFSPTTFDRLMREGGFEPVDDPGIITMQTTSVRQLIWLAGRYALGKAFRPGSRFHPSFPAMGAFWRRKQRG